MRSALSARLLCVCAVASFALPGATAAQRPSSTNVRSNPVVIGTLKDALSGSAVEGAMVVLLDSAGDVVVRSMTGPNGAFRLESRRGGRFVVRADRIGHQSTFSDELELHAGETIRLSLEADVRAIQLAALDVEADPRCEFRPEEGRAVARLWAEARKSLETARWSAQHGLFQYEFVEFERTWDRSHERVQQQVLRRRVETAQAMFGSVAADELIRDGFVVEEGSDRVYRGPDAEVMLSDPFLDTHCFRIGRRGQTDRIALEFEPVEDVERTEIEGVLFLDRQSGELKSLEYQYKNINERWGEWNFGGRIEFDRLPSGPSIVRRWAIWMPSVDRRFGERRERLVGILEQGAEVLSVRAPLGELIRTYDAGRVRGVVTRGPDQRPAPGVIVALDDADAWAESDSMGAFEIGPLIGGPYTLRVHDEALTHVGVSLPALRVSVQQGEATERNIHVDDPEAVLFGYCGRRRDYQQTAVLVGRVRSDDGTTLLDDAKVRVSWLDTGRAHERDAESNESGFFVICGVPRNRQIAVTAEADRSRSEPEFVRVPQRATQISLDLVVPPPPPR